MDFFKVPVFILKQVLSHHFVSAQDLGATGNMDIREKIFKFSVLSKPD